MTDWMAIERLADAIGISDGESIAVISQTLSYLGITSLYPGRDNSISDHTSNFGICLSGDYDQDGTRVEFDFGVRQWRLNGPPTKLQNGTDKEGATLSQPQGDGESPNASPDKHDWIRTLPPTEHVRFLVNLAWEKTLLGPIRKWPITLRLMTQKMLVDPRPACLYWGKERIAIYNEPFVALALSRHPAMMGAPARVSMPATWPFLSKMFDEVERTGQAFSESEFEMEVHKEDGFLEEAWYDGIWSPIRGLDGSVEGFYNSGYEITRPKLLDRRNRLLHQIASPPKALGHSVWQHITDACKPFERDIPMLALYSAHANEAPQSTNYALRLEGSLGISQDDPGVPDQLDLLHGTHELLSAFRTSKMQASPVLLDTKDGFSLPCLDNIKWRGFGEPSRILAVVPLFLTGLIGGFLVVGLNPRIPYNEDHRQFVEDLGHASAAAISERITYEHARAREDRLLKELTEKERFTRKLAKVASVGIYSMSASGEICYANSRFHQMVGMPNGQEETRISPFIDCVLSDDKDKAFQAMEKCISHKTTVSINIRLRRTWLPPGSQVEEPCWILNSITPDVEDGRVTGVIGCLSDISHNMWALRIQTEYTKVAEDAKRQQERFIDVTSHEMRNPLSAVMQCADSISVLVERARHICSADETAEYLANIQESAQTILFCTSHQKRIIDDVLVVSKIDSELLTITPIPVQPEIVVGQAMQIFEAELADAAIDFGYTLEESYNVSWAHCDPTRLTQILINLLTNAIKFTKTSATRSIHVTVGASNSGPPPNLNGLQWSPKQGKPRFNQCSEDEVFLTFAVRDTGAGMSMEGMSRLFNRFTQASPMTHVQYGGSGLGLYISRELTELQGGMIGVKSQEGHGSTFGFYVKARRASPDEQLIGAPKRHTTLGSHPAGVTLRRTSAADAPLEILLVEDNLINQKVLSKQLQRLGCTVYIANHGLEALDFVKKTRYWRTNAGIGHSLTAILMDWEMPVCDGITATRRLRELEAEGEITERLLVIAATANARTEQVSLAVEAGCDDLLAKPFTAAQAIKKIQQHQSSDAS